jgi:hypothetical protein
MSEEGPLEDVVDLLLMALHAHQAHHHEQTSTRTDNPDFGGGTTGRSSPSSEEAGPLNKAAKTWSMFWPGK